MTFFGFPKILAGCADAPCNASSLLSMLLGSHCLTSLCSLYTHPLMLNEILEQGRVAADEALERLLPPSTEYPVTIHRAMRHSVFAGGKRMRPILCMEAGRMVAC